MEILSETEYKCILGYLPATIIKNVIEEKVNLKNELPQHYLTDSVGLFSDISGFTKLSEAFSKKGRVGPEFLTFCINRYMEQIINIIGANGGDIFKFVGDALMVIWPPDNSPNFLETACKRACQCAMDIQSKLNELEIVKGKTLSVKIGIGVGACHILFVGGFFGRCEYLCVGECMRQACESETHSSGGGQVLISEKVKNYVSKNYTFQKAEVQPGYSQTDDLDYFLITGAIKGSDKRVTIKADAFLMRKMFDIKRIKPKIETLRTFIPASVRNYLNLEQEKWCKEIRLITSMFLNIKIDLSQLKDESAFRKVQTIANTVQRCIYRTRGALNKFLMDDKGSVMLVVWGLPPFSSRNDPLDCVCSCMTILDEFKKLDLQCGMGVATGTCMAGVCGTVGNRREYSLLGEITNLSSRYMSKGLTYMKENQLDSILVIDEKTKDLIQNKIRCKYLLTSQLKGFSTDFNFFVPIKDESDFVPSYTDPFPFIRTHCLNSVPFTNNTIYDTKNDLANSLKMVGREEEKIIFVEKLKEIIGKKGKKIFAIRGQYGTGKSFFIRKVLFTLLNEERENKKLAELYFNNPGLKRPNIILCNFQYPMLAHIPFNGICMIMRQIYKWLNVHVFRPNFQQHGGYYQIFLPENDNNISSVGNVNNYKFDSFNGDLFAEIVCRNNCLEHLETLEEIFSCSKEDITLYKHFEKNDYNQKISRIQESFLFSQNLKKNQKAKKRDPFFDKLSISNINPIISLFFELLDIYKKNVDHLYKSQDSDTPLFLVIEDLQSIDDYSLTFISRLINNPCNNLKPFIVITSYQEPFRFIKSVKEPNSCLNREILNNMTLEEFANDSREDVVSNIYINNLTEVKDIEEMVKDFLLETNANIQFDSLFKVDPFLVRILIDKSYGGIPLLIRDLLNELIKSKFIQNCIEEILTTSELEDMEEQRNYNEFTIPTRIEKICGEMIDSIKEREIIILKHASVIGNLFDLGTLHAIIPFQSLEINDIYEILLLFERKGMIEILYDLSSKKKNVICKFSSPFLRETLYQRMLIEQRTDIHNKIARLIQKNKIRYLPNIKLEKINLQKHLENGEKSIIKEMETTQVISIFEKEPTAPLNANSMKTLIVKEICDKLINNNSRMMAEDQNIIEISPKLRSAIKYGMFDKKSDGKITWESRFFVMTQKSMCYYYHEQEYLDDKVPLAEFDLKDIYEVKQLPDYSHGNKKNIFTVSVTKWIKKEMPKGKRSYIFSCITAEDLYSWIISMNFMKVKAYYDSFANHFGKLELPLYRIEKFFIKQKKYILDIECEKKAGPEGQMILNNKKLLKRRTSIQKDVLLEKTELLLSLKKVFIYGLGHFMGIVQDNLKNFTYSHYEAKEADLNDKFFGHPSHLKVIQGEIKFTDSKESDKKSESKEESEESDVKDSKAACNPNNQDKCSNIKEINQSFSDKEIVSKKEEDICKAKPKASFSEEKENEEKENEEKENEEKENEEKDNESLDTKVIKDLIMDEDEDVIEINHPEKTSYMTNTVSGVFDNIEKKRLMTYNNANNNGKNQQYKTNYSHHNLTSYNATSNNDKDKFLQDNLLLNNDRSSENLQNSQTNPNFMNNDLSSYNSERSKTEIERLLITSNIEDETDEHIEPKHFTRKKNITYFRNLTVHHHNN